jgi:teichuronic acid biosynthesis glycosyltransferase TuaC
VSQASKAVRVLWVIPGEEKGANMVFARRLVDSLMDRGVEGRCFFLASRSSPSIVIQEWRRLRADIRSYQPDVVHAQYGTMTALLCVCATKRPVVVTFRGSDLNPSRQGNWLRSVAGHMMSHLAALRARHIICVSRQLAGRLWWGKKRVTVLASGVDTRRFCVRPRDAARRELGWDANDRIVLFNGAQPKVKRLDLAEAAVQAARAICGELRFVCLDGSQSPDLIPTMMNASDCLLLCSDFEGSPTVVLEAIASGLPVVSRDVGDVRERLEGISPSKLVGDSPREIGAAIAEIFVRGDRANLPPSMDQISFSGISRQTQLIYQAIVSGRRR